MSSANYDPDRRHRRSIRLPEFDYASDGAYFVTICTQKRACLFGEIVNGEMGLNEAGRVVQDCWLAIPTHFSHVSLGPFVVMPNHLHGIIVINKHLIKQGVGAQHAAPLLASAQSDSRPHVVPGSLGAIVRSFKAAATRCINTLCGTPGEPVWQRNYYEHVVRDDADLDRIWRYIEANPARWDEDRENPAKVREHSRL